MEYWKLKYLDADRRRRAVGNLKRLRRFLDAHLPQRTAQGTLVLGTWNIRNFDNNRFRHGPLKLFDVLFREEDFSAYANEVDARLAARIAELTSEEQALQAKPVSVSRTQELEKLSKKRLEIKTLRSDAERCKAYFLEDWRTFQLSDHFPLWVELDVDFAEDYLDNL